MGYNCAENVMTYAQNVILDEIEADGFIKSKDFRSKTFLC